jgi:hypothetical protein
MEQSVSEKLAELKHECDTNCYDGDCGDCVIMEQMNELRATQANEMTDDELEEYCEKCEHGRCNTCVFMKEIDWRRRIRTGRDVAHDGSIIEGGGVSKPEWMDEDQYSEYKMTAEYAHEVSYQGFDEPDEDDYY